MSQPFKLYRLQQLDSHIDKAQNRLTEIESALSDDREIQRAQVEVDRRTGELDAARKSLHRAEDDVSAQRIKIEQTEASLYGGKVRNPKELQDLQNEAAALKRYLGTLEDRQFERMLAVEEAEEAQKAAIAIIENIQQRLAQQHLELTREKAGLLEEVRHLLDERQAAASTISPEDLSLYDLLRQQRRGVAVALVTDKTCAACGSTLSAALLHAARSPSQIARCDACGRILYMA